MLLRNFLTFEADFPDDWKFAASGDVNCPGGLAIARTVCEMLRAKGLKVTDPMQHSFYGWSFSASDGEAELSFLLQFPGPWLLLSQDKRSFIRKLLNPNAEAGRWILTSLNESLRRDLRFREIRWFTKREFERGKARSTGECAP